MACLGTVASALPLMPLLQSHVLAFLPRPRPTLQRVPFCVMATLSHPWFLCRMIVELHRKVSSLIEFLKQKWALHEVRIVSFSR